MTPQERVAAVLTEARAEMARQRKSQAQLAEHLNITQASLSRRFTGAVAVTFEEVALIEDWLGLAPGELGARVRVVA